MPTAAHPTRSAPTRATVTRHIDAPIETVFSLLADVRSWPRWGPFTDTGSPTDIDQLGVPHPLRLGRRQLHVALSHQTPRTGSATGGPAHAQHTADVTLSPTDDGGTNLHWRATPTRHLPGTGRRRAAALEAAVAGVAAQLASAADDPATTRAEWAQARQDTATAPLRSLTAVPAGGAVAA